MPWTITWLTARRAELPRERSARQRAAVGLAQHGLAAVVLPQLDEVGHERDILLEELVQPRAIHRGGGEAVHPERRLAAFLHAAHEHFVGNQALQRALRPTEELGARMHPQREVDVEQQRLALALVQPRGRGFRVGRIVLVLHVVVGTAGKRAAGRERVRLSGYESHGLCSMGSDCEMVMKSRLKIL